MENDLVLLGERIVVPKLLQTAVLRQLHQTHLGVDATRRRASQLYFWPGQPSDVWNMVMSCEQCAQLSPSQAKEPIVQCPTPSRAFEITGADLFSYADRHYLVYTDLSLIHI